MSNRLLPAAIALFAALGGTMTQAQDSGLALDFRTEAVGRFGMIEPVTATELANPLVELGRALYWDARLSANGEVACASCHLASAWGADPRPRSRDARGRETRRHAQTVFNALDAERGLRWLADRPDGVAQALGSITGSMGFARVEDVVPVLVSAGYAERFRVAFPGEPDPISANHYAQALSAYQGSLRTPADFDRWLAGDDSALTARQREGLQTFMDLGCASCHDGPLLGGRQLARFGVHGDYRNTMMSDSHDTGLASVTGLAADRDVFRVQPLRNVEHTAPYFHDGSVAELGTAVTVMAELQLGITLDESRRQALLAFLNALSGPMPQHFAPAQENHRPLRFVAPWSAFNALRWKRAILSSGGTRMKRFQTLQFAAALALTVLVPAATGQESARIAFDRALGEPGWIGSAADNPQARGPFRPLPPLASFPVDPLKRTLGFALFHDVRLSRDGTVACNTCHMGMRGGTDGLTVSTGIDGAQGVRNTPTVFNAAFNFRQFWDGRAETLVDQALEPITNPVEMGHDLEAVLFFVAADPVYGPQFAAVYPDGVTAHNLGDALGQHVRDMTRTDSRFNAYLQGQVSSLTAQEQRGLERFKGVGCAACHNGIGVGGNSYQRRGSVTDLTIADAGLFNRSGRQEDRGVFKVPSLHNVALTAPYFHDGSVATLTEAVQHMADVEAGRTLSTEDVTDIVAFLNTLSSDFFASMAPRMNNESIRGEMRQQLDVMDHGAHHDHAAHRGHAMPTSGGEADSPVSVGDVAPVKLPADHAAAYAAVLAQVQQTQGRLVQALMQVNHGAVDHYDFVQVAHLDLLRQARALQHPPVQLTGAHRDQVIAKATRVLEISESLEWVVADFLRAQAALRSARANLADLQSIAAPNDAQRQAMDYQQQRLAANADAPHVAMERVFGSGLDAAVTELRTVYLAKHQ